MAAPSLNRRALLAGAAAWPIAACTPAAPPAYAGGWVGANLARGHRLRDRKAGGWPAPEIQRRCGALVIGAGIAGLAAARTLAAAGIDDVQVFELEDEPGGNSRGHVMGGMACPLGAHYLPLPGASAVEVIELLDELGLRRVEHGAAVYDEMTLCHSPQERLFIGGWWHDGLLPPLEALPQAERESTRSQYRAFAAAIERAGPGGPGGAFAIPTARARWSAALDALDAVPFAHWLDQQGLNAPALRWYLDYCCRDDYGAGAAQVSAWAGVHYFASRHGFRAPGSPGDERASDERSDAVLTWPEGNAWLSRRLAAALGARLQTGRVVLRVEEQRAAVEVDLWNASAQRVERWTAPRVVLAVPLFVAARLLVAPGAALREVVARQPRAPWLVANLQLDAALDDRPGAPPSWDNVLYDAGPAGAMLGYVDAMHQSTRSVAGPTVLTAYWSLGGDSAAALAQQRARLLEQPWQDWAAAIVQDLARAHPDLPAKLRRVDLMRYGHAMSVPAPGLRSSAALRALAEPGPEARIHFAHSDLAAYSVFEEALYHGRRAATMLLRQR